MAIYYTYILRSQKDDSLYIGLTSNLFKRFIAHNQKMSLYTKGHAPYQLLFYAAFPNKFVAARFEKYLKSASGKAFANKRLIDNTNIVFVSPLKG